MNSLSFPLAQSNDLKKGSGLSDETIREAELYPVPPHDFNKIFGSFLSKKIESALAFPYPGCDGFTRYRLFPPVQTKNGEIKYFQATGTRNFLYVPPGVEKFFEDVSISVYITEGEKKALKATQSGLWCVAIGGLWNWGDGSEEKRLIPDFDKINLKGRTVYLVPDNDWLSTDRHGEKKNLREAVIELGYRLIDRGARVFIIYLPEGAKIGIDDYLCNHTTDEFKTLTKEEVTKHSLDEMLESLTDKSFTENQKEIFDKLSHLSNSECDLKIIAISKKTGIKISSLRNDFNSFTSRKKQDLNVSELLEEREEGCRIFTAQNYHDGVLSYGAVINGAKLVIESTGNIILPGKEVSMKFARSKLTKEAIKRFLAGEDVNGTKLHSRLFRLFSDHIYFDDKRIPGLLATWAMGSYFYKPFPYWGYILFVSVTKRCAKSLAEDLLSCVCHNATTRSINPSEASVFRQVDGDDITLIIDEVETLRSKEKPEIVGLINSGFQKGSTVTRIESKGKEFFPVSFNAYGPKILAGIRGVPDTVEDRSFKIPMVRKTPGEKVKRFNVRLQDNELARLRDDLFIFGLRHGQEIVELYDGLCGKIPELEGFDDRQKDILEPLACIDLIIDELAGDDNRATFNDLIELSKVMGRKRLSQEKLDGSVTTILEIIEKELDGQEECFIPVSRLFERVNTTDGLSFKNANNLGRYMSKLDIYSEQRRVNGENTKGYFIAKRWVEDQKRRYIS
ncbi:MAG: DUF3854 domain-containing protein [bacterium]